LLLAFPVFVIWNGGVALGDVEQHPVSLNVSNLYFFLLLAWFLFLPFNLAQLGNIKRLLQANSWLLLVLVAAFAVYFLSYEHPHKYNTPELGFYRHNLLLHYSSDFTANRVAAFIPMAWMALSVVTAARSSDYPAYMWLLLPFALLSFVPLPLIEPRYYFVTLSLLLAFRPAMSTPANTATLIYYILASSWILYNISREAFFI